MKTELIATDKVSDGHHGEGLSTNKASISRRLLKTERFFHYHQGSIKYIQLFMLTGFLILTIVPLFSPHATSTDTILTSPVLLSQFLFWGVWYGACLFSVIPFGRLWCGVLCPLGALSEWVGKIGLQRAVPGWVRWNGWLVVMFTLVTVLGQTMDVRDDPAGLAKLFLYIFILAIIIGFIYGKKGGRPWCRYYCPIGKILGVVSRLGMVEFRPQGAVPKLSDKKNYFVQGRLCPTDYNLPYKSDTANCISCGKCAYGQKKSGLGLYWRKPGEEAKNILQADPGWSETIFILISPGLAAGGFLWLILNQYEQYRQAIGNWFIEHNSFWIFQPAVSWISSQTWNQQYNWLDVGLISAYILAYALITGVLSTLIIGTATWILASKRDEIKSVFIQLVYQCIPISILSIVIGLCGKFFEVMQQDFSMPESMSFAIKLVLLLTSLCWSMILSWNIIKTITPDKIRRVTGFTILFLNICMILVLWWPAIIGHGQISEIELIRHHIHIPG